MPKERTEITVSMHAEALRHLLALVLYAEREGLVLPDNPDKESAVIRAALRNYYNLLCRDDSQD